MKFSLIISAVLVSLLNNFAFAHTQSPHVHGVASIQATIDAKEISITFSSPLDSLVGFEHAPQDSKQRKAVDNVVKLLNSPDKLFLFTVNAKCKASSIKISSPAVEGNEKTPINKGNDSHMELEAEYLFSCENSLVKDLSVNLFTYFPNIKQIDYQMVGPKAQFGKRLSPSDKQVAW